jgi:chemotaxis protein CheC
LALLGQAFAAATEHASTAMEKWTNGEVKMTLDVVREVPLEEVTAEMGIEDSLLTMVVLDMEGEYGGQLILCFDDVYGRSLAECLLNCELPETEGSEVVVQSALMETGNILASAYYSELSRLAKSRLFPSPPMFIQDFGGSILEQALMGQAMQDNNVIIGRTLFEFKNQAVNWSVFFVPQNDLLDQLREHHLAG